MFHAAWKQLDPGAWTMEVITQGYPPDFRRIPPMKSLKLICQTSSL